MKTFISLLLYLSVFSLSAQEIRIGYIDSDSGIASLPEVQRIEKQLAEYSEKLSANLQLKTNCYPLPDHPSWTELDSAEREEMERQLAELEAKMAAVAAQAEAKYENKGAKA